MTPKSISRYIKCQKCVKILIIKRSFGEGSMKDRQNGWQEHERQTEWKADGTALCGGRF